MDGAAAARSRARSRDLATDLVLIKGAFAVFLAKIYALGYELLPHTHPLDVVPVVPSSRKSADYRMFFHSCLPVTFVCRAPTRATRPRSGERANPAPQSRPETQPDDETGAERPVTRSVIAPVARTSFRPGVAEEKRGDVSRGRTNGASIGTRKRRRSPLVPSTSDLSPRRPAVSKRPRVPPGIIPPVDGETFSRGTLAATSTGSNTHASAVDSASVCSLGKSPAASGEVVMYGSGKASVAVASGVKSTTREDCGSVVAVPCGRAELRGHPRVGREILTTENAPRRSVDVAGRHARVGPGPSRRSPVRTDLGSAMKALISKSRNVGHLASQLVAGESAHIRDPERGETLSEPRGKDTLKQTPVALDVRARKLGLDSKLTTSRHAPPPVPSGMWSNGASSMQYSIPYDVAARPGYRTIEQQRCNAAEVPRARIGCEQLPLSSVSHGEKSSVAIPPSTGARLTHAVSLDRNNPIHEIDLSSCQTRAHVGEYNSGVPDSRVLPVRSASHHDVLYQSGNTYECAPRPTHVSHIEDPRFAQSQVTLSHEQYLEPTPVHIARGGEPYNGQTVTVAPPIDDRRLHDPAEVAFSNPANQPISYGSSVQILGNCSDTLRDPQSAVLNPHPSEVMMETFQGNDVFNGERIGGLIHGDTYSSASFTSGPVNTPCVPGAVVATAMAPPEAVGFSMVHREGLVSAARPPTGSSGAVHALTGGQGVSDGSSAYRSPLEFTSRSSDISGVHALGLARSQLPISASYALHSDDVYHVGERANTIAASVHAAGVPHFQGVNQSRSLGGDAGIAQRGSDRSRVIEGFDQPSPVSARYHRSRRMRKRDRQARNPVARGSRLSRTHVINSRRL